MCIRNRWPRPGGFASEDKATADPDGQKPCKGGKGVSDPWGLGAGGEGCELVLPGNKNGPKSRGRESWGAAYEGKEGARKECAAKTYTKMSVERWMGDERSV